MAASCLQGQCLLQRHLDPLHIVLQEVQSQWHRVAKAIKFTSKLICFQQVWLKGCALESSLGLMRMTTCFV